MHRPNVLSTTSKWETLSSSHQRRQELHLHKYQVVKFSRRWVSFHSCGHFPWRVFARFLTNGSHPCSSGWSFCGEAALDAYASIKLYSAAGKRPFSSLHRSSRRTIRPRLGSHSQLLLYLGPLRACKPAGQRRFSPAASASRTGMTTTGNQLSARGGMAWAALLSCLHAVGRTLMLESLVK
jgi:hypothetical protein